MSGPYQVVFSDEAEDDLLRLFDFALMRELESSAPDLGLPERAIEAIRAGCRFLAHSPFGCRKAPPGHNGFVRELLISFGAAGYVALFEIVDANTVIIGAVRHQREEDYR
ncbi:MAG: type II toxin-antitoxin system RelE/ParE family toxin [Proteobacteria bacterium]|nr:type II toxin-antitoxin system RelE/ParE family toxin [Pseudomonadota bacterium]